MSTPELQAPEIEHRILIIREQRVILDTDLAKLYGVPTKRLNEQVKRNRARFPMDFMWQLSHTEKQEVVANCDHLAHLKFSKVLPYAFTEHGAMQAANVLASTQAIAVGIYIVRAFVRLRELITSHKELAARLNELENHAHLLTLKQETFERHTRDELKAIITALRALMATKETARRPIGFIITDNQPAKPTDSSQT